MQPILRGHSVLSGLSGGSTIASAQHRLTETAAHIIAAPRLVPEP